MPGALLLYRGNAPEHQWSRWTLLTFVASMTLSLQKTKLTKLPARSIIIYCYKYKPMKFMVRRLRG